MKEVIKNYVIEIQDVGWISEVIAEKFDNALGLMSENDAVYGGAVRDAIAGIKLQGDLDIAVPASNFTDTVFTFDSDALWTPVSGSKKKMLQKEGTPSLSRSPISIGDIVSYQTINGSVVQLIKSEDSDPWHLARIVDIKCCGVVMSADGRVFEVLPGAKEDCEERKLRFNTFSDEMHIDTLNSRVEKLVARGWENEMNVAAEVKAFKKKCNRKARKHMSKLTIDAGILSSSAIPNFYKKRESPFDYTINEAGLRKLDTGRGKRIGNWTFPSHDRRVRTKREWPTFRFKSSAKYIESKGDSRHTRSTMKAKRSLQQTPVTVQAMNNHINDIIVKGRE